MTVEFGLSMAKLECPAALAAESGQKQGLRQTRGVLKMAVERTMRNRRGRRSLGELGALSLGLSLTFTGCSHAPEYSIFGSFFPAWIFCSVGGLALVAGARALIARTAMAQHLAAPVLSYLSMAIFLTCMLWLLFYS